ncbi:MAG: peptidoglycan DD-metalloendopeptidase family protein [Deltaproteobacteria bacterium]|nr:MAG: peptidoglycan DD-metalloendopeptidase family protein [Deltaproteobacteria bacterium]
MKMLLILFIATLFILPSPSWSKGVKEVEETIQKKKGDLTEIQKQLQEKKEKARKKRQKERKITDALDNIGRRLNRKKKELRKLNAEMKVLGKNVAKHEREIAELERLLTALEERFQSRVRAMYKLHRVGLVRVLFSAEDYSDALRRYKAFRMIIESDSRLLEAYQRAIKEREERKNELIRGKSDLQRKKGKIEAKKKEIEREKRKKSKLLASVKAERRAYLKAIAELKESEKELRFLIDRLRLKAASLKGARFEALRGKLLPPVKGSLFSPQGRKRGIGIKAREGAEIKAVYGGKVVYASWFKGYGNLMIIDHGDGYYTILAHASRLLKQVGSKVKMGEVVALVGSTGSLEGPMLYFEIRHHGKSEDPLTWLAFPHRGRSKKR